MRIALRELAVTEAAAAALFPEKSESGALLPLSRRTMLHWVSCWSSSCIRP